MCKRYKPPRTYAPMVRSPYRASAYVRQKPPGRNAWKINNTVAGILSEGLLTWLYGKVVAESCRTGSYMYYVRAIKRGCHLVPESVAPA